MGISPYVARLREHIGSDLLLLPCVTVLVENEAGKILMVRNTGYKVWSTMGGMIEPREHPEAAVIREVKEETNLDVEVIELVTVLGGPECVVVYPNDDQVSYVACVYRAKPIGGIEQPDMEEVGEIGWFDPTELAALDLDRFARYAFAEIGVLA
ncbi:MAG: NUDIX domain-containing protein [Acidimicrobiales bacterium]